MAINPYEGTSQEQLGDLIADLRRRVDRLELEDRLTRVHPITGNDDFEGTVFRTPDRVPVFIASRQGGLELDSRPPTREQDDSDFLQITSDDPAAMIPGPTSVYNTQWPVTLADAVVFGTSLQWAVDPSYTGDYAIEMWLTSQTLKYDQATGRTLFGPEDQSSPVVTFSDTENVSSTSDSERFSTGRWIWRHGQALDPQDGFRLIAHIRAVGVNGSEPPLFNLFRLQLFDMMQRGAESTLGFDPEQPYSAGTS